MLICVDVCMSVWYVYVEKMDSANYAFNRKYVAWVFVLSFCYYYYYSPCSCLSLVFDNHLICFMIILPLNLLVVFVLFCYCMNFVALVTTWVRFRTLSSASIISSYRSDTGPLPFCLYSYHRAHAFLLSWWHHCVWKRVIARDGWVWWHKFLVFSF